MRQTEQFDGDFAGGFMDSTVQLSCRDRIGAALARKQPAMRQYDVPAFALAPPQSQQF
jgi:hypothetical protein